MSTNTFSMTDNGVSPSHISSLLPHLSSEDLKPILNDDTPNGDVDLEELIKDLPQIQSLQKRKEFLLAEYKSITGNNHEKEILSAEDKNIAEYHLENGKENHPTEKESNAVMDSSEKASYPQTKQSPFDPRKFIKSQLKELKRKARLEEFDLFAVEEVDSLKERCDKLGLTVDPCQWDDLKSGKTMKNYGKKKKKSDQWEVEAILDAKGLSGPRPLYLIKWKDWDDIYNSWEPLNHLGGATMLLKEFHLARKACKNSSLPSEVILKFRPTIEHILSNSFGDEAVILKLTQTPLSHYRYTKSHFKSMKDKLREMCSPLLKFFENGLKPKNYAAVIDNLINRLEINRTFGSFQGLLEFIEKRKTILPVLRKWEKELTKIEMEDCGLPIHVENLVDLEGPPQNFTYIPKCKPDPSIIIEDDPPLWCECEDDCFNSKDKCCPANNEATFAYTKSNRLWLPPRRPIFECNKKCKCSKDCSNRVIQKGRRHRLAIFRTDNDCDWGVRALTSIPKGQFVTEYVGEIITVEEAERREKIYSAEGKNYLFDLDFNPEAEGAYVIDASHYGNVAHFINHSCDPNLSVYAAWIDNYNTSLPRIAFFSRRNIRPGEELTFDYHMSGPKQNTKQKLMDLLMNNKNLSEEEREKYTYMLKINLVRATDSKTCASEDEADCNGSRETTITESSETQEYNHDQSEDEADDFKSEDDVSIRTESEASGPVNSHKKPRSSKRILCKCGSSNCRFYLF